MQAFEAFSRGVPSDDLSVRATVGIEEKNKIGMKKSASVNVLLARRSPHRAWLPSSLS